MFVNLKVVLVEDFNNPMDEEKERQKEVGEKLESEGLDPDEFDEDEQEELANLL